MPIAVALGGKTLGADGLLRELPSAQREISDEWLRAAREGNAAMVVLAKRFRRE